LEQKDGDNYLPIFSRPFSSSQEKQQLRTKALGTADIISHPFPEAEKPNASFRERMGRPAGVTQTSLLPQSEFLN
jgi:hypothetical protein